MTFTPPSAFLDSFSGPCFRPGLGGVAVFACSVRQDLRTVPLFDPCLVAIAEGTKEVRDGDLSGRVGAGGVLAFLPGDRPDIANLPDPTIGRFRSLVLVIAPEALTAFARHYPALASRRQPEGRAFRPVAGAGLGAAILHAAQGLRNGEGVAAGALLHRQMEVLVVLAEEAGFVWPLPGSETTADRVRRLVSTRIAVPWSAADAAKVLGISEPTLRRRLAAEGTSFRGLLADARLSHGLTLLQTTKEGIAAIALACGYESPSRFAARFNERFGMTPSALRGDGRAKREQA